MKILKKIHFNKLLILSLILTAIAIIGYAPTAKAADSIDTNRYFYNQLTDVQKKVYDALYNLPDNQETMTISKSYFPKNMDITTANNTILLPAVCALSEDNPECTLKYRGTGCCWFNGDKFYYTPDRTQINNYTLRKSKETLSRWINAIGKNGDSYTKLRKIYDLMTNNIKYDMNTNYLVNRTLDYDCTSIGPTVYGEAVCEGYSATFKTLCDAVGVPCIKVGNYAHAWNYVQMEDGKWYAVDVTSATPEMWEQRLLLGLNDPDYSEYYASTKLYIGNPDYQFTWPELSKDNYVYTGKTTNFSYTISKSTFQKENGHFVYTKNEDGTWSISDYYGEVNGQLIIPKEYKNKPVTTIGESAFYHCSGFTGTLIIPENIKEIKRMAFARCSGLSGKLVLSNNLTKIGDSAFVGCRNLENEVYVPKTCFIDEYAFYFNHESSAVIHRNEAKMIEKGNIDISQSITYNGKKQTPSITVTDESGNIIYSDFYTVTYRNNKNVGKASITVIFKDNYVGKLTTTFTIKPPKTSLTKLIKGSKSITVKWKKLTKQTTGYQIQYAANKNFKSAKKITIKNNKKTSVTIKKLKKNKKYYIRIRTYKTMKINGKKTTIYSNWSNYKTIKTK